MLEKWKPIKGFEEYYDISNLGNIRRKDAIIKFPSGNYLRKGKLLKPTKNSKGYLTIILCSKGNRRTFTIHRLVADAFIIKIPNKNDVNHINGNRLDNTEENLEWCNPSYNQFHAYEMKLKRSGEDFYKAKLSNEEVKQIKILLKNLPVNTSLNKLFKEIAKKFGVSRTSIKWIYKGNTWRHITVED